MTLVCAGDAEEAAAAACLRPDMILAESPALIGSGSRGPEDAKEIARIIEAVHRIAPGMKILHGAGIHDEKDVFQVIMAGADATGSSSAVMQAENREEMLEKMIEAVSRAWKIRKGEK